MSAELPNNSSSYANNRLEQLERRLEKAKEARDNYIEFLKQNRAQSSAISQNDPVQIAQPLSSQRPSLIRRLETGQYFWNFQSQPESHSFTPLPTNEQVPRGMVLSSDMNAMTKRLREIGSSIRNMRDYRLSMPSDEYFRSVRPHLQSAPNVSSFYGEPQKADLPSLAEIRSRILNMQFNVERRTRELIDQRQIQQSFAQPNIKVASLVESSKQPDWLRQKELEDELKKLRLVEQNAQEASNQFNEPTTQFNEPVKVERKASSTTVKMLEPKTEDKPLVISSNRQIVFGLNNAEKPAETELPRTESTKDNRAPPAPKPLPSFLQTQPSMFSSATPARKTSVSQVLAKPNLDDSDSDFFK
ncbi:hypothetical protein M3Y97_00032700 [Aphelenchoides bicaudatus]|nr:hypothetical protein M3Y97_00032700 [Aphelenchoides bicaudatus]